MELGKGLADLFTTQGVEVQIAGPSLTLFFAALGAQGSPPTISSPDGSFTLTSANCPPSFQSFFELWQASVKPIQRLSSDSRHDLALLLAGKETVSSPIQVDVVRLASNLKEIGLEITQRRTFQQRYQQDLDAALQSHVRPRRSGESERHTLYSPPPAYDGPAPSITDYKGQPQALSAASPSHHHHARADELSFSHSQSSASSPRLLENLSIIRETLYSALADILVSTPSVLGLLGRGLEWASRAYFASTCLAILEVALTRVDSDGVRVVNMGGSSPRVIGPRETPPYLRKFLGKLVEVSQAARAMAEEDDERAMREAAEGDITSEPRLDRLRERLEKGAGGETSEGSRTSTEQTVASLANAINELAIGMASLPAFSERQTEVFKVLSGISSM
ncbi:hypothetical protein BCR35DRAFT_309002 [Leucosporidium creatinivorum]|uniref:Uncharacterized protein n=1 Tax=Leucosporidium creatinivorum TaxID=106004 RepID=A0A1Y2DRK7_9BASI|nr:hypothetical protein BCR35DRAFT_309002 [Leucosporidium creatinivorum]